jgi:hypothetical protein
LIEFQLIAHGLSPVQFIFGQVFAELFKTSIMVIPDVGVGLAQLLSDLCERVALKEVQAECLSLILGQVPYDLFPSIPAKKPFDRLIVVCPIAARLPTFKGFVRNSGHIEPLGLQMPSSQERLSVGHLNDPRAS